MTLIGMRGSVRQRGSALVMAFSYCAEIWTGDVGVYLSASSTT